MLTAKPALPLSKGTHICCNSYVSPVYEDRAHVEERWMRCAAGWDLQEEGRQEKARTLRIAQRVRIKVSFLFRYLHHISSIFVTAGGWVS